jgi:hypothetical protein
MLQQLGELNLLHTQPGLLFTYAWNLCCRQVLASAAAAAAAAVAAAAPPPEAAAPASQLAGAARGWAA